MVGRIAELGGRRGWMENGRKARAAGGCEVVAGSGKGRRGRRAPGTGARVGRRGSAPSSARRGSTAPLRERCSVRALLTSLITASLREHLSRFGSLLACGSVARTWEHRSRPEALFLSVSTAHLGERCSRPRALLTRGALLSAAVAALFRGHCSGIRRRDGADGGRPPPRRRFCETRIHGKRHSDPLGRTAERPPRTAVGRLDRRGRR